LQAFDWRKTEMSRIEANPQVQQELQSRGVTDAAGVLAPAAALMPEAA
jgi:hypothetical protein